VTATRRSLPTSDPDGELVAAALAGNEQAFAHLVERYRAQLQLHCYRMLGSLQDAEDLVQETFLRAWRRLPSFRGRSTFRTWLYRIATNACLDFLDRRQRRPRQAPQPGRPAAGAAEVPWLEPYPDRLLEQAAAEAAEPEAMAISRETIELAFLVAIQHLPARQRAVLILRDVLGWPADEAATTLEVSVAAVKSALQRARATLREHLPRRREEWATGAPPTDQERAVLERYVAAHERRDPTALAALLAEDARLTMPPQPTWYAGRDAIVAAVAAAAFAPAFGQLRLLPTWANRQPAAAFYVRRPGDAELRPFAVDVLRVEAGQVAEVTAFGERLVPAFGLPASLR
jgi:RNA polymerase sigma-70 factor, ECF subfamily